MESIIVVTAAVLGIIGISVMSTLKWVRSKAFVIPKHSAKEIVRDGNLSYIDVQAGLAALVADAIEFQPDAIFGINRGGAIVGGVIAKALDIFELQLLNVNCDRPNGRRVYAPGQLSPAPRKILLVDDAKRKGEHMRESIAYLRFMYPGAIVRRVVLLELKSGTHMGPERETFREHAADVAGFKTLNASVKLPWDKS